MTVSAREVLLAARGVATAGGPPIERPKRLDVSDPGSAIAVLFVQEVQEIYKNIEPDYEAPMNTIFAVAKRHELVATIDHCDVDYWTEKKQVQLLAEEELDGPFEVELFKLTPHGTKSVCKFRVAWPDLRTVALVMPKQRRVDRR